MRVSVILAIIVVSGCATRVDQQPLYVALGEREGIGRLSTDLLDRVYADDRIAFLFENAHRPTLEGHIADHLCHEVGGPCDYKGLPMIDAHLGMGIREDEFELFVEHMIVAMESQGFPVRTQNRVLALMAPLRSEIINR